MGLRSTQTSLNGGKTDWLPWLRFFLISMKRQKDHLIAKLKGYIANEYRDLAPQNIKILDYIGKYGRITTSEAHKLINEPRPTVKVRLARLVNDGFVILRGKGRGSYYEKAKVGLGLGEDGG